MNSMNAVFLMGNLTRDPDKRVLPSGMAVSELGLAVNDNYKDKDGKLVEKACFADIVVWGKAAENCAQYLKKGSPVLIEGRLQLDQWQTDAGEKRSKLRVRANRVQFISNRGADKTRATAGAAVAEFEDETDEVPF